MNSKLPTSIAIAVVTALTPILLAAPVWAAPSATPAQAPSTSVGQAAGPLSGPIQLPAHGSQWFKFKYAYDNSDSDNEPTQAVITLQSDAPTTVGFEVWTLGRMRSPQRDNEDRANDKVTPVGMGTPVIIDTIREHEADGTIDEEDVLDPQTLVWAGSQKASDTFYVLVKNTGDAPVNYTISISGPDVSY
jgi:hypothetical protein